MKTTILSVICMILTHFTAIAQLNVVLLHQLVEHSKQEYNIQQTLRNTQATASSNQHINQQQTSSFKSRYRTITQRFHVLGSAMQTFATSLESAHLINEITTQHARIINLLADDPSRIPLATRAEVEIAGRASQLARYILGLMISYGEINQMKQSDRRLLYAHVITELKGILSISRSLFNSMYYASLMKKLNSNYPFAQNIQSDKRIVENILSQIKSLKQ